MWQQHCNTDVGVTGTHRIFVSGKLIWFVNGTWPLGKYVFMRTIIRAPRALVHFLRWVNLTIFTLRQMAHKWFDHMNWKLTVLPRIGGMCRGDTWYNTKLSKVICFFATPVFPRFCCTVFVWILEFNPVFPFIVCLPPQCTAIDSSKSDLDLALFFGGEMKCTRKCQRYIYSFESNIDGSLALVVFFFAIRLK